MEAANAGSKDGGSKTKSFGLHIDLPFETTPNDHLDITYHHKKFSSRLDEFMRISHAVIVTILYLAINPSKPHLRATCNIVRRNVERSYRLDGIRTIKKASN